MVEFQKSQWAGGGPIAHNKETYQKHILIKTQFHMLKSNEFLSVNFSEQWLAYLKHHNKWLFIVVIVPSS